MPATPTCHHVLASGALCQATPLRNRNYCRFHLDQIGRRMRAARSRARHPRPLPRLPLLEDLFSVQVAIIQVSDAVHQNEMDVQRARVLTTLLRLAMQNLKSKQLWEQPERYQLASHSVRATTEWDSFEQEYDLPPGLDLSLDPEVAFPPQPEAEPVPRVRDLPLGANPGVAGAHYVPHKGVCDREGKPIDPSDFLEAGPQACRVTADQVEVADVLDREGEDAMLKVIARQQRNRERRERQLRRLYYEEAARNHSIKRSAEKIVEDQKKAEAAAARAAQPPAPKTALEERYEAAVPAAQADRKPPQSEAPAASGKAAVSEP